MNDRIHDEVLNALSTAGMQPFLEQCGGHVKHALRLYVWHSKLVGAVQAVLGTTEVILRNAMDRQLQEWNQRQLPSSTSWLLEEPAEPLRGLLKEHRRTRAIQNAKNQARNRSRNHPRYDAPVTHDDVLTYVMFGVWRDLLPNHRPGDGPNSSWGLERRHLWEDALSAAFLGVDDLDGSITFWRVHDVHRLRNRVSHMESLLGMNVKREVKQAYDLVGSINPRLGQWITSISEVNQVLDQRPD